MVFARRPDEREAARRQILTREGEFAFEDVPVGDYTISLDVPGSVEASPVTVAVAAGETVVAKLVMANAGVCLTVKVPKGRGMDLQLASADPGTPEPEQTKPRIIMREAAITVNGKLMKPPTDLESVSFDHLVPGKYRASIDGQTWTPIVVTSSPAEQSVEIKAD